MRALPPTLGKEVSIELGRLLSGVATRRPGVARASPQRDITTRGCERLNEVFFNAANRREAWTPEVTWWLLQKCLDGSKEKSQAVLAACYLLVIGEFNDDRVVRGARTIGDLRKDLGGSRREYGDYVGLRRYAAAVVLDLDDRGDNLRTRQQTGQPEQLRGALAVVIDEVWRELRSLAVSKSAEEWVSEFRRESQHLSNDDTSPAVAPGLTRRGWHEDPLARADYLDQAPEYYPPDLRPSRLSRSMTASPLGTTTDPISGSEGAAPLYANSYTSGGRPVLDVLDESRRIVVLADPGFGKSTVLSAFVANRLRSGVDSPSVFVRLSQFAHWHSAYWACTTAAEAVAAVVQTHRRYYDSVLDDDGADGLLRAILQDPDATIALDGLDEVTDQAGQAAARLLLEHLRKIPGRLIVSSRFTGFERLFGEWSEYSLDRLANESIDAFVRGWYPSANEPGYVRAQVALSPLNAEANAIRKLAEIPFLLGLVLFVSGFEDIPSSPAPLYERYLQLFLERRWKPYRERRLDEGEIERLRASAGSLAWAMAAFSVGGEGPSPRHWADLSSVKDLRSRRPDLARDTHTLIHVDGLLVQHGDLGKQDARLLQRFRWLHRTVHEYLVAAELAEWFRRDKEEALEFIRLAAQHRTVWIVPLQMLIDLSDESMQDEVLSELQMMVSEGDPNGELSWALAQLAGHAAAGSRGREAVLRRAVRAHDWARVVKVDRVAAHASILERLKDLGGTGGLEELDTLQVAGTPLATDLEFLRSAIALLASHRAVSSFRSSLLSALASWSLDEAIDRTLDLGTSGAGWHRLKGVHSSVELTDRALGRLVEGVERRPLEEQLARLRLVHDLSAQSGRFETVWARLSVTATLLLCRVSSEEQFDFDVTQYVEPSIVESSLRGEFGELAALWLGLATPKERRSVYLSSWADVGGRMRDVFDGAVVRDLATDIDPWGQSLEGLAVGPSLVESNLAMSVTKALGGVQHGTSGPTLIALVNYWGWLMSSPELQSPSKPIGARSVPAFVSNVDMTRVVEQLVLKSGWDHLWAVARDNADRRSMLDMPTEQLGALVQRVAIALGGQLRDDDLFEVCESRLWSSRLASTFPIPRAPEQFAGEVLRGSASGYVSNHVVAYIARALERVGALGEWRDQLVRAERQNP